MKSKCCDSRCHFEHLTDQYYCLLCGFLCEIIYEPTDKIFSLEDVEKIAREAYWASNDGSTVFLNWWEQISSKLLKMK